MGLTPQQRQALEALRIAYLPLTAAEVGVNSNVLMRLFWRKYVTPASSKPYRWVITRDGLDALTPDP